MAETVVSPYVVGESKRNLDLLCVSLAVLPAFAVGAAAAAVHRIRHGGPVFFHQERLGRHNETFDLPKLRTMDGLDEQTTAGVLDMITGVDDTDRITPTGHFLRRAKIDEFPQLALVARGAMSIVGPRPIAVWQHEYMHKLALKECGQELADDFEMVRDILKPGLIDAGSSTKNTVREGGEEAIIAGIQNVVRYMKTATAETDVALIGSTATAMLTFKTTD